jgi:hypothetical protein
VKWVCSSFPALDNCLEIYCFILTKTNVIKVSEIYWKKIYFKIYLILVKATSAGVCQLVMLTFSRLYAAPDVSERKVGQGFQKDNF